MSVLVSLDLETTGTDPRSLYILEIGAIAVESETLREIGRFHEVIHYQRTGLEPVVVGSMHEKNGLWVACAASGTTLDQALDGFSAWVESLDAALPALLGRNVGTFDRQALECARPGICKPFHHRHVDLSTISFLSRWAPDFVGGWKELCPPQEGTDHRALDDAEKAIADFAALIEYL